MPTFIGGSFANRTVAAPSSVSFVNSAKATTPPTTTSDNFGATVVVPLPAGVEDGDLLLAMICFDGGPGSITPPAGWTNIMAAGNKRLYVKEASSESGSYTFTADLSGSGRSGVIAAFRYASLGDYDFSLGTTFPTVTAAGSGAALVCFVGADTVALTESFAVASPLTEQTEHVAQGNAYSTPQATVIATEIDVTAGDLTGRTWSNGIAAGTPVAYAAVLEVAV